MAFIRWNENTQIWELANNPLSKVTTFNHLPIANPTLPLDTVNKQYVDAAIAGISGWQVWTPVWKNSVAGPDGVIGNGAIVARYSVVGKTVHYTIQLFIGSTTVFPTNNWAFTLPFPTTSLVLTGSIVAYHPTIGRIFVGHTIPGSYFFGIADTIGFAMIGDGSINNIAFANPTFPFTWAANDNVLISGFYERT